MIDDLLIETVWHRFTFRLKYPGYVEFYLRWVNDWPWGRHHLDRWYWRVIRPFGG